MNSEFLIVARRLMEEERRPMSAREIVDLAQRQEVFSDKISGKTPHQTMKSKLSVHIRKHGDASPFIRTAPGRFYLRELLNGERTPFHAKPLRPPTSTERVLAYDVEALDKLTDWQGIKKNHALVARRIFKQLNPHFIPRFDVERDNAFTQIVTYVMVTKGNAVLAYRRGTYNRVDKFLKGAFCVGFGGHVIDSDVDLFSFETVGVVNCAIRELSEELVLPPGDQSRLQARIGLYMRGILNDDSSDVGRRHLAFVMEYQTDPNSDWSLPRRGEKAITQLQWINPDSLPPSALWNFEYWSQLCLRSLAPTLIAPQASYRLLRMTPLRPPHVICVVGPVGSGKTFATEMLKYDFGYSEINSGRVVAEIIGIPPVPQTPRLAFQEQAWRFISSADGPAILGHRLAELVRSQNSSRILIDGLRQRATLDALQKYGSDFKLGIIYVQTPPDLAYNLYANRTSDGTSVAEFLKARESPVEADVESLITKADAIIYNWTGKAQYKRTLHELMRQLNIERSDK